MPRLHHLATMPTTPLQLEYTLQDHGWARTVFTVGDERFEFENAYGSDPIGNLAQLAIHWGAGIGVSKTEIVFDCENLGNYIASFKFRDPAEFELWFEPWDVGEPPAPQRTLLAACEINSFAFAVNIASILDDLLRTHGFVGYLQKWQHFAFPLREYLFLRLLLDESPIIAQIAIASNETSLAMELDLLKHRPIWSTAPRTNALAGLELPRVI